MTWRSGAGRHEQEGAPDVGDRSRGPADDGDRAPSGPIDGLPTSAVVAAPVVQIAWAVSDLDEAATRWARNFGAGPFFANRHFSFAASEMDVELELSIAIGRWANVEIELIQQHCDTPSWLFETGPDGSPKMAHIAWYADDLLAEVDRLGKLGFGLVHLGSDEGGATMAWVDTRPIIGAVSEIYRDDPERRARKRAIEAAAETWDGTRPIRER